MGSREASVIGQVRAWGGVLSPDGEPQVALALEFEDGTGSGSGQHFIDVQYSHDGEIIDGDARMPPTVFEDFLLEGMRLLMAADPASARRLVARVESVVREAG
jgi:hypothetical protein